jgi:outer membrane protein
MKRVGFIGLLLLSIISFGVFAQDRAVLTLEESVDLALENNPEFKTAEKELRIASAGILESYSIILPQLNGSLSYQRTWEIQSTRVRNFFKDAGIPGMEGAPDYMEIAFGIPHTLMYGATVTQPLFLGGAGIAGIKMAYAAEDAARQNLEAKRQDLIYRTANAFYSCLLAEELVKVREEALKQAQANLDVVLKKYDVGSASGFDKMRAEVEVANLHPQVIAAKNNLESAYTNLRMVLGLEAGREIEISGQLEYKVDDFGSMELIQLQEMAKNNRPERQAVDARKRISKNGVTAAFGNFLPKIVFQTDLSYLAQKDKFAFDMDKDFSKGFSSAISVQIPIFQGFKSVSQYQQAKLNYKISLDAEKQVDDGIAAGVEYAYNKFREANEKYLSAQQTVELAEEALRLANLMYDEGANTQLDVLVSQLALTEAKLNYVSSLFEYQIARYQLRIATGQLTDII